MLMIKPNCECCEVQLSPDSTDAMICSYECTFCRRCVAEQLQNVCPNCGGGFTPRPIRPKQAYRDGVSLLHQPASDTKVVSRYTVVEMGEFAAAIAAISPEHR
ncbi:DUF1272 domain-containing protein [Shewanella sp. Scap07]|uniref:DUF1272 domain-containing protein n=1 Tax=Shewanella sp. Scap07 TaxID=2589987 RepID=UPI0015BDE772|nr:DUF1272 domain-containing protein [Shewanella sp. Scap07]QLE86264.1 DUF1272 domain-containing protein [Shewanella sp. Scap07]